MPVKDSKNQSANRQQAKKQLTPSTQRQPAPLPGTFQPADAFLLQRAMADPQALSPADIQRLQRTVGNRAVQRLLAGNGQVREQVNPIDAGQNNPASAAAKHLPAHELTHFLQQGNVTIKRGQAQPDTTQIQRAIYTRQDLVKLAGKPSWKARWQVGKSAYEEVLANLEQYVKAKDKEEKIERLMSIGAACEAWLQKNADRKDKGDDEKRLHLTILQSQANEEILNVLESEEVEQEEEPEEKNWFERLVEKAKSKGGEIAKGIERWFAKQSSRLSKWFDKNVGEKYPWLNTLLKGLAGVVVSPFKLSWKILKFVLKLAFNISTMLTNSMFIKPFGNIAKFIWSIIKNIAGAGSFRDELKKAKLFQDTQQIDIDFTSSGVTGGQKWFLFFEGFSLWLNNIRDWAGWISVISGLIGLFFPPALGISAISGGINVIVGAVTPLLNTILWAIAKANKFKAQSRLGGRTLTDWLGVATTAGANVASAFGGGSKQSFGKELKSATVGQFGTLDTGFSKGLTDKTFKATTTELGKQATYTSTNWVAGEIGGKTGEMGTEVSKSQEGMSLVWQTFKEALGKLFKQLAPLIGILTDIVEFLAKAISVVISFVEFITRLLAEIGKILFGLGDMEEATEQAGGETIQQFYRSAFGSLQGGLESGKKWLQTQIQRLQNFMGMESEIIQDVGEDTGEQ